MTSNCHDVSQSKRASPRSSGRHASPTAPRFALPERVVPCRSVGLRIPPLGAARVLLAGERVARGAELAASFVAADVDRVSLRGPSEVLILRGVA